MITHHTPLLYLYWPILLFPYPGHDIPYRGENDQYHFVYVVINQVNKKFYIGKHSTSILDDGYLGSARRHNPYYWNSIDKYGVHNFQRFEIAFFDTADEAFLWEKEIITENMITSNECYNIHLGGDGGWDHLTPEQRIKAGRKGGIKGGVAGGKARVLSQLARGTHVSRTENNPFFRFTSEQQAKHGRNGGPKGGKSAVVSGQLDAARKVSSKSPNHISRQTAICPWCNESGQALRMKQDHFDNCPKNPNPIFTLF